MSMYSAIIAESHNEELQYWKNKFEDCKTFEDFKKVLSKFKKVFFHE